MDNTADERFGASGYPRWWVFITAEPAPAAEVVSRYRAAPAGGAYVGDTKVRYCPRCTTAGAGGAPKVPGHGRAVQLVRRHYPDIPETYWDCPACHTTWREGV